MAKSPWRRANSSTAKPEPLGHTGNDAPTRISSGPSTVDQWPVKNSGAGMVRSPAAERA